MRQKITWFIVIVLVLGVLSAGCGSKEKEEDFAVTFAAYQFAKSEIQTKLPTPNSAVFPSLSTGNVEVIENDDDTVEISGSVTHNVNGERVTSDYKIVVLYEGNGLWRTQSLDIQ